jgi:hypothetical protein
VGNQVYDNNRPNTADPEDLLGALPPGIGVLLTAADRTSVSGNAVTGNQFAGIGVTSLCLAFTLQEHACEGLDIVTFPRKTWTAQNWRYGRFRAPPSGARRSDEEEQVYRRADRLRAAAG